MEDNESVAGVKYFFEEMAFEADLSFYLYEEKEEYIISVYLSNEAAISRTVIVPKDHVDGTQKQKAAILFTNLRVSNPEFFL